MAEEGPVEVAGGDGLDAVLDEEVPVEPADQCSVVSCGGCAGGERENDRLPKVRRVLVADDDVEFLGSIEPYLHRVLGAVEVVLLEDLDSARVNLLDQETHGNFDLALIDQHFPDGQKGSDFVKELRDKGFDNLTIILCTAGATSESITHVIAEADGYLLKDEIDGAMGLIFELAFKNAQLRRNESDEHVLALLERELNYIFTRSPKDTTEREKLQEALDMIIDQWKVFGAMGKGSIHMVRPKKGGLKMKTQVALPDEVRADCDTLELGECLCGMAAVGKRVSCTHSVGEAHHKQFEGMVPHGHDTVPIFLPLLAVADEIKGLLNNDQQDELGMVIQGEKAWDDIDDPLIRDWVQKVTLGVFNVYKFPGIENPRSERVMVILMRLLGRLIYQDRQRRKEEKKNRKLRALVEIVNNMDEPALVLSGQGLIEEINPAFTKRTGLRKKSRDGRPGVKGDPLHFLRENPDQTFSLELQSQLLESAEETEESHIRELWFAVYERRRNEGNKLVPVRAEINANRNRAGEVDGYVVVLHDNSDLLEERRKAEAAEKARRYDALTGLPNRLKLEEQLPSFIARSMRRSEGRESLVFFLDLDGFKRINDTYGHDFGDLLLKWAAEQLQGEIRSEVDQLFRLGGDEFVMLLEDADDFLVVANKILSIFDRSIVIQDEDISGMIGTSIGGTSVARGDNDPDLLLKQADAAMFEAKRQGRRRAIWFELGMEMDPDQREVLARTGDEEEQNVSNSGRFLGLKIPLPRKFQFLFGFKKKKEKSS